MSKVLRGLVAVLPTPLCADETVDTGAARRLATHTLAGGAKGLWVLGTTGEMAMLREDQKLRMIEVMAEEVADRVPIIAGVGDTSTRRVLDNIKHAALAGADLVHVLPPFYLSSTQKEAETFFRRLADESKLPLVIYNHPHISRISICLDIVASLAEHSRIVGIKDSSGDMRFFQSLSYAVSDCSHFGLLQGSDKLVYLSLKVGGDGAAVGLASIAPHLFSDVFQALEEGDEERAREQQKRLVALAQVVYACANPVGGIKFVLHQLELCPLVLVHPYQLPSPAEQQRLLEELKRQGIL